MTTRLLLLTCPAAVAALMLVGCGSAAPSPAPTTDPSATPAPAPGPRGSEEQLQALAARATPHLPDGRPDFNATWDHLGGIEFVRVRTEIAADGSVCVFGCAPPPGAAPDAGGGARRGGGPPPPMGPGAPTYKPEFLAKVKDLSDRQVQLDTNLQCAPPGVPRIGPPGKIIQNAREVVFLYDDVNGGFFRIIPTDGRPHPTDTEPSYLGDAVGRYEGDALIVETRNLNEETWLTDNGAFHTADLKVTERLTRVGDTVRYEAVADDPAVLAAPWALRPLTLWVSDQELAEPARCEDRDLPHMVDGSYHTNPR
jgi:hypothetical protein